MIPLISSGVSCPLGLLAPLHVRPCVRTHGDVRRRVGPCKACSAVSTGRIAYQEDSPITILRIGDRLLDYMAGGPKLRKWYGIDPSERPGEDWDEDEDEDPSPATDFVLVTDADNETGQLVVLGLILARKKVSVLVRNAREEAVAFGPYVSITEGSMGDKRALAKAMRGASAIICCGKLGYLPELCREQKPQGSALQHLVFLSPREASGNGGAAADVPVSDDEAAVKACGVPFTIMRTYGKLSSAPGSKSHVALSQPGTGTKAPVAPGAGVALSRENLALAAVNMLQRQPQSGITVSILGAAKGDKNVPLANLIEGLVEDAMENVP